MRASGRGRESNCVSRAPVNRRSEWPGDRTARRRTTLLSRDELILVTGSGGQPAARHADRSVRRGWLSGPVGLAGGRTRNGGPTASRTRRRERRFEAAGLVVAQQECLMRWPRMGAAETAREENEVFDVATTLGAAIVSILSPGDDRHSESELAEAMAGVCDRGSRARLRHRARGRALERNHRHPHRRRASSRKPAVATPGS